jgi:hypothetical protein
MTAPETGPGLNLVGASNGRSEAGRSQPGRAAPSHEPIRRRRLPLWLLAAIAVAAILLAFFQARRASELSIQVVSLEAEVASTAEKLRAYQSHLGEVRTGVDALSGQLESLRELVGRDPLTPAMVAPELEPASDEAGAAPDGESGAPSGVEESPVSVDPGPAPEAKGGAQEPL